MTQPTDDAESRQGLVWRDARLPLLRDGWFLAALVFFLVNLAGSAWMHNVWGMVASPLPFVILAWWRHDLARLADRRSRRRRRRQPVA